MKLQFNFISLFLIPTAFAAGWWLSEYKASQRIAALEQEHAEREREVRNAGYELGAATFIIAGCRDLNTPPDVLRRQKPGLLVGTIYGLALAQPYGTRYRTDTFLMHADHALAYLEVNDVDELLTVVRATSLLDRFKRPFLDAKHEEYDAVIDFVQRAFARQRAQPTYPARLWLRAIGGNDADLLRTAFSAKIQQQVDAESWAERLKTYQAEIQTHQAEFNLNQFAFGYTTGSEDGVARIFLQDQELCTFKIVKEEDGWKLDELQGALHLPPPSETP